MRFLKSLIWICPAVMTVVGLSSCEGRTTKNVVPTGDTVEVVINTPEMPQDSVY